MLERKEISKQKLNIPLDKKVILCLDGGGMRGIFTIQILKKLEEISGSSCYAWCDMIAGTSTGAIIAGLILKKMTAIEIEDYYKNLIHRVFTKRNILSNRFYNPPAFDKTHYRKLLKEIVGDDSLEKVNQDTNLDMLFTTKDMHAGEETFFTCFNVAGQIRGTYKSALLRGVMEATMSAPTYFAPFERFIDGGTTTFNNPTGAAVLEALNYDGAGKYQSDKLVVFSIGTGSTYQSFRPEESHDPKGLDAFFWLNYVISEAGKDASEMQVDTLRSGLIRGLDFRRYQLSLDTAAVRKLPDRKIDHIPNVEANWLHELSDADLNSIDMADTTKFELMKSLGEAVANYICPEDEKELPVNSQKGNWFRGDLIKSRGRRGELVTAHGEGSKTAIKGHLSNPEWIDYQQTK